MANRLKKFAVISILLLLLAGMAVASISCAGPDRTNSDHNKHSSDGQGHGCGH